jgi:hypothetical protein
MRAHGAAVAQTVRGVVKAREFCRMTRYGARRGDDPKPTFISGFTWIAKTFSKKCNLVTPNVKQTFFEKY